MKSLNDYFQKLSNLPQKTIATGKLGLATPLALAIDEMITYMKEAKTIFACGNGGSASIASHCASHYPMFPGLSIDPLNDISAFSATANDSGYEHVYANQIYSKARPTDLVIAISSSGSSPNILNAAKVAKSRGCKVATLSGFAPDNPLRKMGDLNFYTPSQSYGHVELTHMTLLHAAFDLMKNEKADEKFEPADQFKHLFNEDGTVK